MGHSDRYGICHDVHSRDVKGVNYTSLFYLKDENYGLMMMINLSPFFPFFGGQIPITSSIQSAAAIVTGFSALFSNSNTFILDEAS
jgi:hypothetical protein